MRAVYQPFDMKHESHTESLRHDFCDIFTVIKI